MAIFGGYSAGIKPGMIVPCAGNTVQDGYLLCDGSAISRTLYPELFAAIGTTYGAGDGSTTFNLPNGTLRLLSDTVPVIGNGITLGLSNGSITGGLAVDSDDLGVYSLQYGAKVGNPSSGSSIMHAQSVGLTVNGEKSGIIADLSATEINLLIKY